MKTATIKDFARMCNKNSAKCAECPLALANNGKRVFCIDLLRKSPDEANEIIIKWCEEHPVKTRQTEFLKMFPNVELVDGGTINICPHTTDSQYGANCNVLTCKECRRNYWSEELEE